MVNYEGLYGSEAPEFLDVAVYLCRSELEHVGVGDCESFGFCPRVFCSELGESVCEVSWFRCWDIVPELMARICYCALSCQEDINIGWLLQYIIVPLDAHDNVCYRVVLIQVGRCSDPRRGSSAGIGACCRARGGSEFFP